MNRYIVTTEYYDFVPTDEEMIAKAKKEAEEHDKQNDSHCKIISIHKAEFGNLITERIY